MNDIALALGGGGMKGFAHVGVLRGLERHGFNIRSIAGTSAGGLVGSVYAAGYSTEEIEACLKGLDYSKLYRRLPGDGPAMMGLAGVIEMLNSMLGEKTFADTRVPFAVTAVNLDTAQLLALQRGMLKDAVCATVAVPGVFPPRQWEDQRLIDGGILDPVPVSLARYLSPLLPVVAVVLSPPVEEWKQPTAPRLLESLPFLATYIGRMRIAQAFNIFLRSVDIAGAELTELRLLVDRPDVIIRPAVSHIGFLDRVDVEDLIAVGEQAVEDALPALRKAVSWRGWFERRLSLRRPVQRVVLSSDSECEEQAGENGQ